MSGTDKAIAVIVGGTVGIIIAAAVSLFAAIPTWLIWNALMPQAFGLNVITFWQAFLLNWMCSILFKSSPSSSKSD